MFDTPILLITFNRPRHTAAVLAEIKKQQPKFMFVFQDGPHSLNPEDAKKCMAVRELIRKEVDWDCELKTLFEDKNLGCGYGPAKAITWFFKHVEEGIILEDDVLTDPSFFPFCRELLLRFKNNNRVCMIGGINFLNTWKKNKSSYIFSFTGFTPGWATWKRAWDNFDFKMSSWNTNESLETIKHAVKNQSISHYYIELFNKVFNDNKDDYWDYQWLFARLGRGLSILPTVNLVSNIGIGPDSTHTIAPDGIHSELILHKMNFPLIHRKVKPDRLYDRIVFERYFNPRSKTIIKRIILKLIITFK